MLGCSELLKWWKKLTKLCSIICSSCCQNFASLLMNKPEFPKHLAYNDVQQYSLAKILLGLFTVTTQMVSLSMRQMILQWFLNSRQISFKSYSFSVGLSEKLTGFWPLYWMLARQLELLERVHTGFLVPLSYLFKLGLFFIGSQAWLHLRGRGVCVRGLKVVKPSIKKETKITKPFFISLRNESDFL